MGYDGFISYSHAADGRFAPALQRGLQRLAKPWNHRRALNIFRDETGLSTNPHLWSAIEAALNTSEWFLLLASPEAAQSEWVNKELDHWLATKSPDRILPVVTDGTWTWNPARGVEGTAVPAALRDAFGDEPRHLDLRWARNETDLDLRNSRFRSAVADLAAPMHGIPKDELEGEDVRQHKRSRRLARGGVTVLVLLVVVALVTTGFAVVQRDHATDSERVADARRLAAQALATVGTDPGTAYLAAIEARRLDESVETRSALLNVVQQTDHLDHLFGGVPRGKDISGLDADGRTLALTDGSGRVELVDVATRRASVAFATGQRGNIVVVFAPGDRELATLAEDGTVRLWDHNGHSRSDALSTFASVLAGSFSPDGRLLATEGGDGAVTLWDGANGDQLAELPKVVIAGADIDFSADGRLLAIAGAPSVVIDLATKATVLQTTVQNLYPDHAVALSPDGTLLATSSDQTRSVELWDVRTQRKLQTHLGVPAGASVGVLAFSTDGTVLAGGMGVGSLTRWSVATGQVIGEPIEGNADAVTAIRFGRDPAHVTTSSQSGVAVWNLGASGLSQARSVGSTRLDDVQYSRDGRSIVVAQRDGNVALLDARNLHVRRTVRVGAFDVFSGAWIGLHANGRFLTEAIGGALVDFDLKTQRRVHRPLRLARSTFGFALSPRADLAAAIDEIGNLKLVNLKRWNVQWLIEPGRDSASTTAFSPDARHLAFGTTGGEIRLLDTRLNRRHPLVPGRNTLLRTLPSAVEALAFTPDGDDVIAGSVDGKVRVIDVSTGKEIGAPLVGQNVRVAGLKVSPDGKLLVVNGRLIYELNTHRVAGDLVSDFGSAAAAFAPDGKTFAVLGDQELRVWKLDPASWTRRACAAVGRNLTRTEWHELMGDRAYHQTCARWPKGAG